jgi:penicillin-binding protein 1A
LLKHYICEANGRSDPEAVVRLTHKLELKSQIPIQPSIALGAVDITVEDMVAAYGTFANQVFIQNPVFSRIEDKKWRLSMNQYLNHMMY